MHVGGRTPSCYRAASLHAHTPESEINAQEIGPDEANGWVGPRNEQEIDSMRPQTVGGPSVAAGEWTRAHRVLVGFVAFITLGLIILHLDIQAWRGLHDVSKNQYDVYLFPCEVRYPRMRSDELAQCA